MSRDEWILRTYNLNVFTSLWLLLYMISYAHITILKNHRNIFDYWFPFCIYLCTWSTQQFTVAQHSCWFPMASNSPMIFSINYSNFIPSGQMVSLFLPYPTFQFHLVLLLFDVLLALLLVGGTSRLCILYHNYQKCSKHSSWSCWILFVA